MAPRRADPLLLRSPTERRTLCGWRVGAPSVAVSRCALHGRRLASTHDFVDLRPSTAPWAGEGALRPVCSSRHRANALCGRCATLATGYKSKPKVPLPLLPPLLHPNPNPGPSSSFPMQRRLERAVACSSGRHGRVAAPGNEDIATLDMHKPASSTSYKSTPTRSSRSSRIQPTPLHGFSDISLIQSRNEVILDALES